MRSVFLSIVVVFAGCQWVPLSSNDPDGGVCPGSSVAAGSATLSAPWNAQAAWESASAFINPSDDGGVRTGTAVKVDLFPAPISCDALLDGGHSSEGLSLQLIQFGGQGPTPGRFPVGGDDAGERLLVGYGSLSSEFVHLLSGSSVVLDEVAACSVRGSINGTFSRADGGTVAVSGTFGAQYCGAH